MDERRRRLTVGAADLSGCGLASAESDAAAGPGLTPRRKKAKEELLQIVTELAGKDKAIIIYSTEDRDEKNAEIAKKHKEFTEKAQLFTCVNFDGDEEAQQWYNGFGIGHTCRKGKKPESPNQDNFSVVLIEGKFAFYGVFDGHGPNGHVASELAREEILKSFLRHSKRDSDTSAAFKEVFAGTQERIIKESKQSNARENYSVSGTTCTMVYHDLQKGLLTVAHVGDSRSVLCKDPKVEVKVKELTIDHKPNNPDEKTRIEAAGGRVIFDGYYNHRVFSKKGMYPGLNMSRALGDILAHDEAGLTAVPDCLSVEDASEFKYLLICSDGVWEFIENPEACRIMMDIDGSSANVDKLAQESFTRWMKDSDYEISDDITAVIIDLTKFGS